MVLKTTKILRNTLFVILLVQLDYLSILALATPVPLKSTPNSRFTKPKILLPKILAPQDYLSFDHYHATCPDLEGIIHRKVQAWIKKDFTLAASIIRLHFHDCAVRGCDASILLDHRGSERRAKVSKTLRGYKLIDEIKAELENKCPKTVSCADILTTAARDATVLAGGPFWEIPFGRKDGKVSIAREANRFVPHGHENMTTLIKFFETQGLNTLDLVVLSGSHTIGRSTCSSIKDRLYDFNGTRKSDPSLDIKYLNILKKKCTLDHNYVDLDATTPRTFDTVYYSNLQRNMGLLSTDQLLYSDVRTGPFVGTFASQPLLFFSQFSASMVKLGNIGVLTRPNEGEIRLNCNFVNRH